MQRLYRESHYANGTIESGEREAPVSISVREGNERRTRMRRDGSREEGRKKARLGGAEDVAENALLIISPMGEES